MAEEPKDFVLAYLRRIDAGMEEVRHGQTEILSRLASVELSIAALRRDHGADAETVARLQAGMDRLREGLGKINRRLDIAEP